MGLITNEIFKNQYGYTFDDLLSGYERSLRLIKKIDKIAHNKIVEIFKYYQTTQPDTFNQMFNVLKEHFLDEDSLEKSNNLWRTRLYTQIDPKKLRLLTSYSVSTIEADAWDMLDLTKMTAFPLELGEKDTTYTIAPIFHDYKDIGLGFDNGVNFYTKCIDYDFIGRFDMEKEYEYVLYKDVDNKFKICRTDLNDKKVIKNMNIEL